MKLMIGILTFGLGFFAIAISNTALGATSGQGQKVILDCPADGGSIYSFKLIKDNSGVIYKQVELEFSKTKSAVATVTEIRANEFAITLDDGSITILSGGPGNWAISTSSGGFQEFGVVGCTGELK